MSRCIANVRCREGAIKPWDIPLYHYAEDGVTEVPSTLGARMEEIEANVKNIISLAENATEMGILRMDMMSHWGTDQSIIQRMGAGGGKCDCCGRKSSSMESGELLQCSRCKQAYYCSAICQKKQWKAGHKQACRAPGQIETGDIMLVNGIVSKPELNRKLVKVIRPAATQGRWEAKLQGSTKSVSIASKNLFHIRPAK